LGKFSPSYILFKQRGREAERKKGKKGGKGGNKASNSPLLLLIDRGFEMMDF
jgi:hypothetical protein